MSTAAAHPPTIPPTDAPPDPASSLLATEVGVEVGVNVDEVETPKTETAVWDGNDVVECDAVVVLRLVTL